MTEVMITDIADKVGSKDDLEMTNHRLSARPILHLYGAARYVTENASRVLRTEFSSNPSGFEPFFSFAMKSRRRFI